MSRFLTLLLRIGLAALLLAGCGLTPAPAPVPIPPATLAASPTVTIVPLTPSASPPPTGTVAPTIPPSQTPTAIPEPVIQRVLIVSFDGLRPDAIRLAPMPNLLALMQTGAYTLTARTIFPSVTLPSHASMLTGQCPAQTGVDWNDYIPKNGYAKGVSIFELAKKAGLVTVMVVGKQKLVQITPPENLDTFKFINDRDVVVAKEAAPILEKGFGLAFVHFATIDDMGHVYGWLSWEQLSVVRRADEALGTLLNALDSAGLRQSTLIILNADHGGNGMFHSARQPENYTIPWVVSGPGVVPQTITAPVSITDTAATAAWALGLHPPAEWVGRPILEAFGQNSPARPEPRCP